LLLADIVELLPTEKQKADLERLSKKQAKEYRFATAEEIIALGVSPGTVQLSEIIGDHTHKTLQENKHSLLRIKEYGKKYKVRL
jgi:hypothetical protein